MFDQTIKAIQNQESSHWDIAQALRREIEFTDDWELLMSQLHKAGLEYKQSTLKAYRRVAMAFPTSEDRVEGASFAAHQAALTAGHPRQAKEAMERARERAGRITRDTVLAEVRQMKGRTNQDTSAVLAAWRDTRRGVGALLGITDELPAFLGMDDQRAAEAAELGRQLTELGLAIAAASKAADAVARKRRRGNAAVAKTAAATPAVEVAKRTENRPKPKIRKLGSGRGE